MGMNILNILTPTSIPVDPLDLIQARIVNAAQVKVLQAQRQMGEDLVALLDPSVGRHLNAQA
jgi:hypothetical protein